MRGDPGEAHRGRCHCGAVAFTFTSALEDPFRCNCSFCVRRGGTMQKVPANRFRVLQGESGLGRYGNRDFSDHYFCRVCGIGVFTRIHRADENSVAVNLACVDGIDPATLAPRAFDGRTLL